MSPFSIPGLEEILDSLPDAVLVITEGTITWTNAAACILLTRETLVDLPLREVLAPGEDEHLARLARHWASGHGLEGAHRIHFMAADPAPSIPTEVRLARAPSAPGGTYILAVRDARHPARVETFLGDLASTTGSEEATLDLQHLLDVSVPVFDALGWTLVFFEETPRGAVLGHVSSPLSHDLPIWTFLEMLEQAGPLPAEQVPLVAHLLETGEARFLDDFPHRLAQYGGIGAPFEKVAEEAGMTYAAWVPLRVEGEPNRLLIVVSSDLTEYDFLVVRLFAAQLANAIRIGRLSRELVQRERLAAVGEMSAVLAHEVRNPLGVIFNVVGGLRRLAGDDPKVTRLVDILSEESERLKQLVGDLLDYARPRAPALQRVSTRAILLEALQEVEANTEVETHDREVTQTLASGDLEASLDPDLFRRALVNVLLNAFQHTPEGGAIQIVAGCDGTQIHLAVSNSGPAIDTEHGDKIFQPFFTTRPRGTGLGLAVARRIIEDLRGEIVLDTSDPVCFKITLPVGAP